MTASFKMNSYKGKQILSLVRDGAYAHAGELEAIEMTLAGIAKDPERRILDAGCGIGGTAAYLQEKGWGRVTGIDIDAESVAAAAKAYPALSFQACNIYDAAESLEGRFDLITLFNVLYAIDDQRRALRSLASCAAPGAVLLLFDYLDLGAYHRDSVADETEHLLPTPIKDGEVEATLTAAGWKLDAQRRIDADYRRWYEDLVAKIEAKREAIEALAGADIFRYVHGVYSDLLAQITAEHLGGIIVKATRT